MKKLLIAAACVLLYSNIACAQATNKVSGTSKLLWDYSAITLTEAQAAGENYYLDTSTTGIPLSGKTCVAQNTVVTCSTRVPVFPQGVHSLQITMTSQGLESDKSNSVVFTYVLLVVPTNLRSAKLEQLFLPADLHTIATYQFSRTIGH